MSVLAMPLSLGDERRPGGVINDVEALVNKVIDDQLRKWPCGRQTLDQHQRSDLASYLIGVAWETSCRYDPAKDKRPNLAAYVSRICSLRIADWFRQHFGDTRHGDKPIVLSLDAPAAVGSADADSTDRLVDTLASSAGDPAVDRSPDLVRVLHRGGRGQPRPHDAVGEPEAGGAAAGDPGAGVRRSRAGLKAGRVPGTQRVSSRPPICPSCFKTFRKAFVKVNNHVVADQRLSDDELTLKAARRAQAVRFGKEWACPRCTKLEDKQGHELMLQQAYPNRASRRAAAKAAGLAANRSKPPKTR